MEDIEKLTPLARYYKVSEIAKKFGWRGVNLQSDGMTVSFVKGTSRINVFCTKMTFVTVVDHPKKGKNILNRKSVFDIKTIKEIFKNPRVHTGLGYHSTKEGKRKRMLEKLRKKQPENGEDES